MIYCGALQAGASWGAQRGHWTDVALASDLVATIDPSSGGDKGTTLLFYIPLDGINAEILRYDPSFNLEPLSSFTVGDVEHGVQSRQVAAVAGKNKAYVFMRDVSRRIYFGCHPSCPNSTLITDRGELSDGLIEVVAIHGEPGRATIFHTNSGGKIRAADFVGPELR